MVILITGRSASGKTHYSNALRSELSDAGVVVCCIDGDKWRRHTGNVDFTDEGRQANLVSAAKEASRYEANGYVVLMSFIAPKKEYRDKMRSLWSRSRVVYLPGGKLWAGTNYEVPDENEMQVRSN